MTSQDVTSLYPSTLDQAGQGGYMKYRTIPVYPQVGSKINGANEATATKQLVLGSKWPSRCRMIAPARDHLGIEVALCAGELWCASDRLAVTPGASEWVSCASSPVTAIWGTTLENEAENLASSFVAS